jgi:hypothetical protein
MIMRSMGDNASDKQHTRDFWRFIRLDEYKKPPEPTRETVRKGISGLWTRLRGSQPMNKSAIEQENLHIVPQSLLDQAAARPEWHVLAHGVSGALKEWLAADEPDCWLQVVVGAPYSGVQEALTHWGASKQWQVIEAPRPDQILPGGEDWLAGLGEKKHAPVVIPCLEGCYLRHYDGLSLVNRVLDLLTATRRRCVIGCDSWAWAFLVKALRFDSALPHPFTLEPFDHNRLERWFSQLAGSRKAGFVFRQADNGKAVLPPIPLHKDHAGEHEGERGQSNAESEFNQASDFLKHLAAHSLGIPGVAWRIWRHSLRSSPIEAVDDKSKEEVTFDQGTTIWVKPWSQVDLPSLPSASDHCHLFLLHSLLLHRGLPTDILVQLSPFSPAEVIRSLHHLRSAGLLEQTEELWRVTALGYPAVRQELKSEGYLVDHF